MRRHREPIAEAPRARAPRKPKLFDAAEIAEDYKVSLRSVRRWITSGALPAYRFGRSVRVAEADLERFLAARRIPSGVPPDTAKNTAANRAKPRS